MGVNVPFAAEPLVAGTVWLDEMNLPGATTGWWGIERRRSCERNPLTLGGQRRERGLGAHADSVIPIPLLDGAARFRALVGIDNETGGNGSVEFMVRGDGVVLWQSGRMEGKAEPLEVDVDLAGVETLELVVTTAGDGFGHDHADWALARLEGVRPTLAAAAAAMRRALKPLPVSADNPPPALSVITVDAPPRNTVDRWRALVPELADEAAGEFHYTNALIAHAHAFSSAKLRLQALRPEALITPDDRDPADVVLRRTHALLHYLQSTYPDLDLTVAEQQWARLAQANARVAIENEAARLRLFCDLRTLRRRLALANPVLQTVPRLLFIKRHFNAEPEQRGNHMCDQFFGFHAVPGGGLFVLDDPFGEAPAVRPLLADSVCTNGRFEGRRLGPEGGYLSPEVSFDGNSVLFAYTDIAADPQRYTWSTDNCYHLFRVHADGSGLQQLSDGPVNDFDPCFLPCGRIAFISERRGGYGRCHGRPVPSFTLHSMLPDGTDIVCLSPHETNEWQPSVTHDGMLAYTRWDYVDRGHTQAHHAWITYPDGRDPRAIHGNFRPSLQHAPTMDMDVRAIPGSGRLMATAAAHHGQAFGSLIVIDPTIEDDNDMAPVKRLTPDQALPETECSAHRDPLRFATPWPLSDTVTLCVYDRFSHSDRGSENRYGIYLIDAFGNRELIYRDPDISCLSPMPLAPRPTPPVIPNATDIGHAPGEPPATTVATHGTVAITTVYASTSPFPPDTRIAALRVIQLLPKTTPYAHNPAIGYGDQKGARAVLGTVPVEEDGSAYFKLKAGIPVYFQALDDRGLAVQSMRSATYVKPGEHLLCNGCHQPRTEAPSASRPTLLAMQREPSELLPPPEGANPFNFPRLVQPVLDDHCVACHQQHADKAPDLTRGHAESNPHHFSTSYQNLRPYAFFYEPAAFTVPTTHPGEFGARASKLYQILSADHGKLSLDAESMSRIALWLDCNSDFFGAYENIEAQARGDIVLPSLQ